MNMKETVKMAVVLTGSSALAAFLLAATNMITKDPIAKAARAEKMDAIRRVLPEFDNDPDKDSVAIEHGGRTWVFYVARKAGAFAGAAVAAESQKAYSGRIEVLVGVAADGRVTAVEALQQNETPGLGAKIANAADPFMRQFKGLDAARTRWAVVKDGGDIQAITGATITSRAVTAAVKEALEVFAGNRDRIEGGRGGKK